MNKGRIQKTLSLIKDSKKRKIASKFLLEDVNDYIINLASLEKKEKGAKQKTKSIEQKFFDLTKDILRKGYYLQNSLRNKYIIRRVKQNFRELTGGLIYKSKLFKYGYEKPAGYPGDYKMLEWLYDDKPISKGLGYYIDNFALKDEYVVAVKNRKKKMKQILSEFIEKAGRDEIKILNLGSGSCREIRELLKTHCVKRPVVFTVVDQDKNALDYSRKELERLKNKNARFNFVRRNVLSLGSLSQGAPAELSGQNMVYSIGLADYIPGFYLEKLIRFSFTALRQRGVFVLAHKDITAHPSLTSDWLADWNFIPRSKIHVLRLVRFALKGFKYKMKVENIKEGRIYFIFIKKP